MSHGRFERGLFELYGEDPLSADERIWGRRSDVGTRRGFLRSAGISALGVAIGLNIPFSGRMPAGPRHPQRSSAQCGDAAASPQ
jgi:hypothetical protein